MVGCCEVERYVIRTAAYAFLAGLTALTGIVWVTQALRQIDLITNKGQSLLVFLSITGLTTPSLVAIIAPVALFAGVIYCLNKLNGDSELVVMSAAGISLRPAAAVPRPFHAGVRIGGDAVRRSDAVELRRDRDAVGVHSRRFHRQFPRRAPSTS